MWRVILGDAAAGEVEEIYRWYESCRQGLGDEFLRDFDRAELRLALHPSSGTFLGRKTRSAQLSRFPYVLLYVLEADQVVVTAVLHSHRHPRRRSERVQERSVSGYLAPEPFVAA